MSSRPFMQLYVADYLGDTMHLSCEQHGGYMLLLMTMWQNGGTLPNDHKKLARICRVTPAKFKGIAVDVLPYFTESGAHLTHNRLTKEIEKLNKNSAKNSENGRKGGLAKSLKNNKSPVANASHSLKHSQIPDTIQKKTVTKVTEKPPRKKPEKPMPENWRPKPLSPEFIAKLKTLTTNELETEYDKFTDYATTHDKRYRDWDAAWRNWVRRSDGWAKPANGGKSRTDEYFDGINEGASAAILATQRIEAERAAIRRGGDEAGADPGWYTSD